MDNFNLVSLLRQYCDQKGWHFIYGNDEYANWEVSQKYHAPGDLVFIADFNTSPVFNNTGGIEGATFMGGVMLGRKQEGETESSLDETPGQKHDRRLEELTTILFTSLGHFACINRLSITQANGRLALNKFDENIDFAVATITFAS